MSVSEKTVLKGCGHEYDNRNPDCQVVPLIGVDGVPYGSSRCPRRWSCELEERMRSHE